VFAVVVPDHLLDGLAWLLTGMGFTVTAAVAARRAPAPDPAPLVTVRT
jgi:hypothetical protein